VSQSGYDDPRLAHLYDALNPWGPSDDHYLGLIGEAGSVLDLGCGTGKLLKRAVAEGHGGPLVGVDVAAAMLEVARRGGEGVDWRQGDARTVDLGRRFELVVMTSHVFQELLEDGDVLAVLATARRHLEPDGRVAFETRNPAAREWERWERALSRVETHGGEVVEVEHGDVRFRPPDLVDVSTTFRFADPARTFTSGGSLRFLDPGHLRGLLHDAGFRIDGWWGGWDRTPFSESSPEVVVLARAA
jgi:SAM-dependent methyltransferase